MRKLLRVGAGNTITVADQTVTEVAFMYVYSESGEAGIKHFWLTDEQLEDLADELLRLAGVEVEDEQ